MNIAISIRDLRPAFQSSNFQVSTSKLFDHCLSYTIERIPRLLDLCLALHLRNCCPPVLQLDQVNSFPFPSFGKLEEVH